MDISVRDWIIIIGVLLIVAVLLDGYRRMRDPKRIRVSLTPVAESEGDQDVTVSRELPNGGARVKPRGDNEPYDAQEESSGGPSEGPAPAENPAHSSAQSTLRAAAATTEDPPLLTEPAAARAGSSSTSSADDSDDNSLDDVSPDDANDPLFAKTPTMRARRGENLDLLSDIGDSAADGGEGPQEVLMLHVVSRGESGFSGDDILQVLLAYNLRFGDMDFFHRHEQAAGRGAVQFSVANMLQPGVFDIDNMSSFTTKGLIFFVSLPGPRDMMGAFELMLETAQGVAEHLGGDVLDESRSATTRQTLEHMRQRIRDLERKLLAQAGR